LQPGDKLPPERELSEQFGVSRNALREALRTLEVAGLVELRKGPKGGAFIREADPRLIIESMRDFLRLGQITIGHLTEARCWIETIVVEVACDRATEADLLALESNIQEGERLMAEGRLREKVDVNIEFHNLLARATKNPVLILNMELLMDLTRHFAYQAEPETTSYHVEWRRRIVRLLRERNKPGAVTAMTDRLVRLQQRYEELAAERAAAGEAMHI
jgi:DNA-binding FadR family transcriptional regulator